MNANPEYTLTTRWRLVANIAWQFREILPVKVSSDSLFVFLGDAGTYVASFRIEGGTFCLFHHWKDRKGSFMGLTLCCYESVLTYIVGEKTFILALYSHKQ